MSLLFVVHIQWLATATNLPGVWRTDANAPSRSDIYTHLLEWLLWVLATAGATTAYHEQEKRSAGHFFPSTFQWE